MASASIRAVTLPFWQHVRKASQSAAGVPLTMRAWCIHDYGNTDQLTLVENMRVPPILSPSDVLVKVHASSVNPIDIAMMGGYGSKMINSMKKLKNAKSACSTSEFPLILGRDFSGVVVKTGHDGRSMGLSAGDKVWGCVPPFADSGSHAEYVLASQNNVVKKPNTLSYCEAASIPYAALTVWSALTVSAGLTAKSARGKRVLVLGASGGAGCFAVQLLKAWNADVTATCSADAVDLIGRLGADYMLEYSSNTFRNDLKKLLKFDLILDCAQQKPDFYLQLLNKNGKFVTLTGPIMKNVDDYGLPLGLGLTALKLGSNLFQGLAEGKHFRWAYFMPNKKALKTISQLCDNSQIVPVVQRTVLFEELPEAYKMVSSGPNRGKTAIEIVKEEEGN